MPGQVAIVHGWSDTSRSFKPLVEFLRSNGYRAVPLWLGDYISKDDDVKIEDVAKRMEEVVRAKMKRDLKAPFDLIVHSTGGLVARRWISTYYPGGKGCPVKRLVMLAPANFGSRLAATGQSLLGRVVKGWDNWFHTGKEMLQSLELASRFQWDLAKSDLFVPESLRPAEAPSPYGQNGVWPFVITGSHPYPSGLRKMVNENGGDGTVRVCAANLNARGTTIDFATNEREPEVRPWQQRHGNLVFPLAVLPDRTHSSIITPQKSDVRFPSEYQDRLGNLILEALKCRSQSEYSRMASAWRSVSEDTAALAQPHPSLGQPFSAWRTPEPEYYHQYFQIIAWVIDDHGDPVTDYFLEFHAPTRGVGDSVYFQREVLEHVHTHSTNSAARCLYVDRNDLLGEYYQRRIRRGKKAVVMSISASPPGDNVGYFSNYKKGAAGHLQVHTQEGKPQQRWLQRNCTHFVKIIIPRKPRERVFRLRGASS